MFILYVVGVVGRGGGLPQCGMVGQRAMHPSPAGGGYIAADGPVVQANAVGLTSENRCV